MGRVFRARDTRTGDEVAVKTLKADATAADLLGLKREFRLLREIVSPYLVPIYDLFVEEGAAHLAMALLRGRTLDQWGQTVAWRETPTLLYDVLSGVVAGLTDLHRHHLVHRDIKPQNVMVEPDGRVLLVDYGLATHRLSPEAFATSSPAQLGGTLAFMSPEAMLGVEAAPARDVFALGASIYFVIVGRPPPRHPGGSWQLSASAVRDRMTAAWPDAPAQLTSLVVSMLGTLEERASLTAVREALELLGGAVRASSPFAEPDAQLVGRDAHASRLRDALTAGPGIVCVTGPSGIGKTSLASRTLQAMRAEGQRVLVLRGRCHPGEHIRHRTLDAVLDELTRWLLRCGPRTQWAVLPADVLPLHHSFPVLSALEPTDSAQPTPLAAEPEEQRRRLGASLASLLANVGEIWPTTIWIDDIQWSDVDGVRLLVDVVERSSASLPTLLLTGQSVPEALSALAREKIELTPIDAVDARTIVSSRAAARGTAWTTSEVDGLVAEAGGNPGLLRHLVDHLPSVVRGTTPTLAWVMEDRLAQLGGDARRVTTGLALATQPVPWPSAVRLAGSGGRAVLDEVIGTGLARTAPHRGGDALELVHDAVSLAIRASLDDAARVALHGELARALEGVDGASAEAVAEHWDRAGEPQRATALLLGAAREASERLAFEHAVLCYERLLAHAMADDAAVVVHEELGKTLGWLGRGREASEHYDRAAALASGVRARQLAHASAIALLHAGYVDDGLHRSRALFGALGAWVPSFTWMVPLLLLAQRLVLRWRRLHYQLREVPTQPHAELADAAYGVTTALVPFDLVLSSYVQGIHLNNALRSGGPLRVARALALESGLWAASGREPAWSDELLGQARTVLGGRDDARAECLFAVTRAASAWAHGRWSECIEAARTAEAIARDRCVGAWWELSVSRSVLQDAMRWSGRYRELRGITDGYLRDAERRGDRYARLTFTTRFSSALALADDRVGDAWTACVGGEGWGARGVHLQHFAVIHAKAECLLYAGRPREALALTDAAQRRMRFSALVAMPVPRAKLDHLAACCRLACAAEASAGERRALLRGARRDLARARRHGWGYMVLLADIGELTARRIEGRPLDATEVERLVARSRALDMGQYGAALERALGGSPASEPSALGVTDAARWGSVLLPGLSPSGARLEVVAPPPG